MNGQNRVIEVLHAVVGGLANEAGIDYPAPNISSSHRWWGMPKFLVVTQSGGSFEVEADIYVDAGHEGRWIDFSSKQDGEWSRIRRVRASDVKEIEQKD
jgi:hypothetical protein